MSQEKRSSPKQLSRLIGPPDILTLCNLGCGLAAILLVLNHHDLFIASLLLPLGALFDMFDGMLARLLKRRGDFGAELDSLADLITFGVAPFVLLTQYYQLLWLSLIAVLIPICGALRLARHNTIRKSLEGYLIGAPIDTSAALIPVLFFFGLPSYFAAASILVLCVLYISTIKVKKLT